jgi:hypothetical protein
MKKFLRHRRSIVGAMCNAVIAAAMAATTLVQVGVGQILLLTENGYTLVRP